MAQRAQAQVQVHAALDDAKERLVRARVRLPAALPPHAGELNGARHVGLRGRVARALVELHADVAAELLGDGHVVLGRPADARAVVLDGPEAHALVRELHELVVREHLEPTRVREDGAVPAHELMHAAHLGHEVCAGAHGEVVGVVENDLGAKVRHLGGHEALDRGLCAHGHEDGRGDVAVGGVEDAAARVGLGVLRRDVEVEQVVWELAGLRPGRAQRVVGKRHAHTPCPWPRAAAVVQP